MANIDWGKSFQIILDIWIDSQYAKSSKNSTMRSQTSKYNKWAKYIQMLSGTSKDAHYHL